MYNIDNNEKDDEVLEEKDNIKTLRNKLLRHFLDVFMSLFLNCLTPLTLLNTMLFIDYLPGSKNFLKRWSYHKFIFLQRIKIAEAFILLIF